MWKVAITDYNFPDLGIERAILEPLDCRIEAGQCRSEEELIDLTRDADYVITQFASLNARVIQAMKKAGAIVRYGIGVDNVDLAAARLMNIPVCNVPDYCTDEVADHTLALMLSLTRQILPNALLVRQGEWGMGAPLEQMRTLRGMTVGLIGFGRIGRAVAGRLTPFGARILACDPCLDGSQAQVSGVEGVSLDNLLGDCDLVSLHCPATEQTTGIIGPANFDKLKHGVLLVNTGRGKLIDTPALIAGLQSGRIGGAALDVTDPEPPDREHPLRRMENVVLSSHIASVSLQAHTRLRETAAGLIARAIRRQPLLNVVNQ